MSTVSSYLLSEKKNKRISKILSDLHRARCVGTLCSLPFLLDASLKFQILRIL